MDKIMKNASPSPELSLKSRGLDASFSSKKRVRKGDVIHVSSKYRAIVILKTNSYHHKTLYLRTDSILANFLTILRRKLSYILTEKKKY